MLGHLVGHWMATPNDCLSMQPDRFHRADTHLSPSWSNRVQPSLCKRKARRDFAQHDISSKPGELLVKLFDAAGSHEPPGCHPAHLVASRRAWELRTSA